MNYILNIFQKGFIKNKNFSFTIYLYTKKGELIDTTNLLIKLSEDANLLQNLSLRKK